MFKLFWVRIQSDIWNLAEFFQVIFFYYSNRAFAKADWHLLRSYFTQNPYRMSKEFLLEKGESCIDTYGETPLTTMDVIAQECLLNSKDIVYELGCGRGRTCYWLNAFVGCAVYGVEYVPAFIRIAQSVRKKYQIRDVKFIFGDLMEVDLENATVIYLYGTTIEDSQLLQLCEKLARLSSKVKIITITFPLSAYHSKFVTIKKFTVKFPWGFTDAYLQKVVAVD